MCGIYGIGLLNGHKVKEEWISGILSKLATESEARGTDATGMAFVTGSDITVTKDHIQASWFVDEESYENNLEPFIRDTRFEKEGVRSYSVLGHCRARTKGSELDNHNNHPIVTDHIVGVHNGVISNDEELYRGNAHIDRRGVVDSEIIFQLISDMSTINRYKNNPIRNAIKKTCSLLHGGFACALVSNQAPHLLWLFRNYNPTDIYIYDNIGLLVFASCESYIKRSMDPLHTNGDVTNPIVLKMKNDTGICIDLKENSYCKFDIPKAERSAGFRGWN